MSVNHVAAGIVVPPQFTTQGIYESVVSAYPAGKTVTGISIPLLGITCKEFGVINPMQDIKEAVVRLYNYAMGSYIRPIFNALVSIVTKLSAGVIDFKLPFLDLTISDLFKADTYDRVKAAVVKLYQESIEQLKSLLKLLGIPWPLFTEINDPAVEVALIVKAIMTSFWDMVIKRIWDMVNLILLALEIYDRINKSNWSITWSQAIKAALNFIAKFFVVPPSISDIESALKEFARKLYGNVELTYQMLIDAMKSFKLPIFGLPLDWKFPEDLSASIPNVDFVRLLTDMKVWLSNFILNVVKKFIYIISGTGLLKALGINLDFLDQIKVPIVLCTT